MIKYLFKLFLFITITFCYEKSHHSIKINVFNPLERQYPDIVPNTKTELIQRIIPSGGFGIIGLSVQIKSKSKFLLKFQTYSENFTIEKFTLEKVYVEANNNGCASTGDGVDSSKLEFFDRLAPYWTYEPMVKKSKININEDDINYPVILILKPKFDIEPGTYNVKVKFFSEDGKFMIDKDLPIELSNININLKNAPDFSLWTSFDLNDLGQKEDDISYLSDEHFDLIENLSITLSEYGVNSFKVPTELIHLEKNQMQNENLNTIEYDFKNFNKVIDIFLENGFRYIEGSELFNFNKQYSYTKNSDMHYIRLIKELEKNLINKGYIKKYYQYLVDEPSSKNLSKYNLIKELLNRTAPNIKVGITLNNDFIIDFLDNSDLGIIFYTYFDRPSWKEEIRGNKKKKWIYSSCVPELPTINIHLDSPLYMSNLIGWLVSHYEVDGFLFWGGNHYRGVNPYKSSIGPIKYGENKTGHPPGDNWLLYPKFGQLVPGIRLLMIFDNLLLDKLKSLEYDDYIREKDYIIKSIYYDYLNNDIEIIFNSDSSVLYNARNKIIKRIELLN